MRKREGIKKGIYNNMENSNQIWGTVINNTKNKV